MDDVDAKPGVGMVREMGFVHVKGFSCFVSLLVDFVLGRCLCAVDAEAHAARCRMTKKRQNR